MVAEAKRIGTLEAKKTKGKKRGPKEKINWYDKVLVLLMYYREYRTIAHIGITYNISEAQSWHIITTLEKWLIKSSLFHLPSKKKLNQNNTQWKVKNIIRKIKFFKIIAEKYRNRRKRFTLRLNLITAIINYEL